MTHFDEIQLTRLTWSLNENKIYLNVRPTSFREAKIVEVFKMILEVVGRLTDYIGLEARAPLLSRVSVRAG